MKRRAIETAILVVGAVAIGLMMLPGDWVGSIDIPINATVLNSRPIVDELEIEGDTVDPRSMFRIRIAVSDNNTINDIESIHIRMESIDDPGSTAMVAWDEEGFRLEGGSCRIHPSACEVPKELDGPSATWVFALSLPGGSRSGTWMIDAVAWDEVESGNRSLLFTVNSYISVRLSHYGGLDFRVPPGEVQARTQIGLEYTANSEFDLLARCSSFVGSEDPSFEIPPSAFSIGVSSGSTVALSNSLSTIASGVSVGTGETFDLEVLLDVPNPFYDQDYRGSITLMLRP